MKGDNIQSVDVIEEQFGTMEYDFEYLCEQGFECGRQCLDCFIFNEEEVSAEGKTYFFIELKTGKIVGYFTISASAISLSKECKEAIESYEELDDLDRKMLVKYKGALGIQYFAIDKNYRGETFREGSTEKKYSVAMLDACFDYLEEAALETGAHWIVLHSTAEGRSLYIEKGFEFLDYRHRLQYEEAHGIQGKDISDAERERQNKFILNIDESEIQCYPMLIKIEIELGS